MLFARTKSDIENDYLKKPLGCLENGVKSYFAAENNTKLANETTKKGNIFIATGIVRSAFYVPWMTIRAIF